MTERLESIVRRRRWLVLLPLALHAAGLNPYFSPSTYDNIVYYDGAVSLAEEGEFASRGEQIVDWPPGTSALIAVPFGLGWRSVWAAKATIFLCAAAGLLLALRLLSREQRPQPVLTVAVFALLPVSFMAGTRILSEWPYFLASMLFLLALHRLRDAREDLLPAVGVGLLLGFASLTKFTGVLLGAAVVAQMVAQWTRARRWRSIAPEIVTAAVGAAVFLAWKAYIAWQIRAGAAPEYRYYRAGWAPEHASAPSPWSVPGKITDLFFHSDSALGALGWDGWHIAAAAAIPGMIVLLGMAVRLRSSDRAPADVYVLALLVLFAAAGENQQTRYLMPVAPFLIGYGAIGIVQIGRWLRRSHRSPGAVPRRAFLAAWIALLVGADGYLVVLGNLNGTHRGLSVLVSPTPESFYLGSWRDLYAACDRVRRDPMPGKVAVVGGVEKYVAAFSNRETGPFERTGDFAFLIVPGDRPLAPGRAASMGLTCVHRYESLLLYQRVEPRRSRMVIHARQ